MVNDTYPKCNADRIDLQVWLSVEQQGRCISVCISCSLSVLSRRACQPAFGSGCAAEGIDCGCTSAMLGVQAGVFGRLAPAGSGIIAIRY
jgi:hypothetical protein